MKLHSDQRLFVSRLSYSWLVAGLAVFSLSISGCANMNHAQSGAVTGTAIGSIAGAMIGGESGHAAGGAVIGALTGAMAGGVLGDAEDARVERDVAMAQRDGAIAQAQYLAQQQQGLTNFDLIRLTQSGISDDVIVNMINTQGGQFDLTTNAIIALKSNGISDRVIVAAQTSPLASRRTPAMAAPVPQLPQPGVVVVQPQPAVVVEPAPPPVFWGWGGYHHHHRGPYRHRSGNHVDLFFGF